MKFILVLLFSAVLVNGNKFNGNNAPVKYHFMRHRLDNRLKHREIKINIKIHGDKELVNYLKKSGKIDQEGRNVSTVLKELRKTIIKSIVSAQKIMNHGSKEIKFNLNLLSVNFMTKRSNFFESDADPSIYLRKYCQWQSRKKSKGNLYYSILITGFQLKKSVGYDDKGNKRVINKTGRTYSGGVCVPVRSCAVIQLREMNLDYLIAHELGHSLGVHHDHPSFNDCVTRNTLMGVDYVRGSHPRGWSVCNRRDLMRFLRSKKATCLKVE